MRMRSLLVAGAAGMLTLGIALPATAAPGDTPVQMTVTGGTLAITVPTGTVTLPGRASTDAASPATISLGVMQVTDARSGVTGWVANVISTSLAPTLGGTVIPASAIGYSIGSITKVGIATYTPGTATANLTAASTVITATGVSLDNSATWTPDLNVAVPANMAAGTYHATITHSVL
jgi:hypothetical protein